MVSRASACESYEALTSSSPLLSLTAVVEDTLSSSSKEKACHSAVFDGSAGKQFFTESLILAQDERWRRA